MEAKIITEAEAKKKGMSAITTPMRRDDRVLLGIIKDMESDPETVWALVPQPVEKLEVWRVPSRLVIRTNEIQDRKDLKL
jgi:hypothetical protein